jgi:hypothetical protein
MGEFTYTQPADTSRRDIARECLHLACQIDNVSPDAVVKRAQAYFDWVMKQEMVPAVAT